MAAVTPAKASATTMYRLVFTVPPSHLEACKTAIFAAGAGRYSAESKYSECCFTTEGTGQFRPGDAARPFLGQVGKVERVAEVRVDAPCLGRDVARSAVEALRGAHPYEEPSYQLYKVESLD